VEQILAGFKGAASRRGGEGRELQRKGKGKRGRKEVEWKAS